MLGTMAGMDQKDSYAARYTSVVDVPVVRVVQVSQVQGLEVTVEIQQLQCVEKSVFPELLQVQFTQTFGSLGTAREVQF